MLTDWRAGQDSNPRPGGPKPPAFVRRIGANVSRNGSRPRLLDLFCGAGGAAVGYARAGFEVIGVDIVLQPHYPFEFHQADALTFPLDGFDAIHASPPCQRYSEGGRRFLKVQESHPDLIRPIRDRLVASDTPWVLENVRGARKQLPNAATICARSMGLPRMARHRLFETPWLLFVPPCACPQATETTIGVYGERPDGRILNSRYPKARAPKGLAEAQEVMGMDWADWYGTKEAIPPAYTEWIGRQLLAAIAVAA